MIRQLKFNLFTNLGEQYFQGLEFSQIEAKEQNAQLKFDLFTNIGVQYFQGWEFSEIEAKEQKAR